MRLLCTTLRKAHYCMDYTRAQRRYIGCVLDCFSSTKTTTNQHTTHGVSEIFSHQCLRSISPCLLLLILLSPCQSSQKPLRFSHFPKSKSASRVAYTTLSPSSRCFSFFFTQVQTPVTLCSGEWWSILVVRPAHSLDMRSRLRHVSSAPSIVLLPTARGVPGMLFLFYYYFFYSSPDSSHTL